LAQIRADRRLLKECFDWERERVEQRLETNLRYLETLPEIEVRVAVILFIDDERNDSHTFICTSPDYIAEAVSRAIALNQSWAHYVANGNGSVEAFAEDTFQLRPIAELAAVVAGGQ
jgi:hypothetical protein